MIFVTYETEIIKNKHLSLILMEKILIVEDDYNIAELVAINLRDIGCEIGRAHV